MGRQSKKKSVSRLSNASQVSKESTAGPVRTHRPWPWREGVLALALIVVTAAVYMPAWDGQPIWDDDAHLTKPELRSWTGLKRIWIEPGAAQQYYPLVHS